MPIFQTKFFKFGKDPTAGGSTTATSAMDKGISTPTTLRVVIADDDNNLSAINTTLSNILTDTTQSASSLSNIDTNTNAANTQLVAIKINTNNLTNWNTGNTCKVTLSGNSLTALPVSATSALNTNLNPMFVNVVNSTGGTTDLTKIGGNNVNVGAGIVGTGTQRITIATDDVNLGSINTSITNWSTGNTCKVTLAGNSLTAIPVSATSALNTNLNPMYVNVVNSTGGTTDVTKVGGHNIDTNSGSKSDGSQRVVIATDDVNLSAMATSLAILDDWDSSDNCKVDINAQTLTAVKISATAAANVTGNRIYTHANLDQIVGTACDVNSGSKSAGCQRVVIATDDVNLSAMATSLAILDDWDSSDNCKVDINAQTLTAVKISATAAANVTGNRIYTHANLDQIVGTACDVNSGSKSAGCQRVVIATDDVNLSAMATSLAILDDWDSSDNCKVDINAQTLTAVKISATAAANATGNRIYTHTNLDQIVGTACDVNSGNKSAGSQRVVIATDDINMALISATTGTDGAAVPTRTVQIGGTDGTNLQALKVDANGQLYTLLGTLISGEDPANDWLKIKKTETGTYSPAATVGTVVNTATETLAVSILASVDILSYPNATAWVRNTGAAALTNCYCYGSPDGTNWVNLSSMKSTIETTCETLVPSSSSITGIGIAFIMSEQSLRYFKMTATCATSTTCDAYITCNKG